MQIEARLVAARHLAVVLGGSDRLVQSTRAIVAAIEQSGYIILSGGVGRRIVEILAQQMLSQILLKATQIPIRRVGLMTDRF